ncbi:MAG: hypothetical protein WCK09_00285 [Bacteroidota bacterium]
MASNIIIRVRCEPYLIRFLETLYGGSPISFPKNSNFNAILDVFLDKPPLGHHDPDHGENTLAIQLPYFELKDIRSYNYLTETKQRIFIKEIWKFFKITYRQDIAKCVVMGLDRKDAIELFIEKYDLPLDCWDSLEKDFQRYLKLRSKKRLFKNNISSAVKDHDCPAVSMCGN